MQQLHHETGEALERPGNAHRRRNLDQDALGRLDVNLQLPRLVDGGVKERQEALAAACQHVGCRHENTGHGRG